MCAGTKLSWTRDIPNVVGWYWVSHPRDGVYACKAVRQIDGMYFSVGYGIVHRIQSSLFDGCKYCGPIAPPDIDSGDLC